MFTRINIHGVNVKFAHWHVVAAMGSTRTRAASHSFAQEQCYTDCMNTFGSQYEITNISLFPHSAIAGAGGIIQKKKKKESMN